VIVIELALDSAIMIMDFFNRTTQKMSTFKQAITHIRNMPAAFWVVIVATLINQMGNMAFVFLVLYCNQALGFSLPLAATTFAAFSGSMLLIGLLGGSVIDRFGALRVMLLALIANGFTLLIFPLLHTYFSIILLCFTWGCTYGLYRPASQAFITQLSTPGMHKITFSLYRLVINLGMSLGPAVGGYLATHHFASIFLANGIANLTASVVLITGLSRSEWFKQKCLIKRSELSMKWLFKDSSLAWFLAAMIPVSMVFFQHESTLAVYAKESLHLSLSFYGLIFTLNTLMIVLFELPLNIATLNWPYRINLALGSAFITAGFAGIAWSHRAHDILLITVIWTIGEMILYPSSSSYIADIAPEERRGSYMSLYSTCTSIGMLLGPWSGALIMQRFGAHNLWLACGAWGLLSVALFLALPQKTVSSPI
jgi:MFS family permease